MSLSSATNREGWLVVGLERAASLYLVLYLDSELLAYRGRLSHDLLACFIRRLQRDQSVD
jgi:hypothetical protein